MFVASSLNDISTDDWFYQAVAYLHNNGIVTGYPDGSFRPNAPISRAEYATLASKFDKLEISTSNIFGDVGSDHWAVTYINSAALKGWISGFGDNLFQPEDNIPSTSSIHSKPDAKQRNRTRKRTRRRSTIHRP